MVFSKKINISTYILTRKVALGHFFMSEKLSSLMNFITACRKRNATYEN